MKSQMTDLGMSGNLELFMDSAAAKSLLHRDGLGKSKHIQIQDLWLQEQVKMKWLTLSKVAGEENLADLGTKNLTADKISYFMGRLGFYFA